MCKGSAPTEKRLRSIFVSISQTCRKFFVATCAKWMIAAQKSDKTTIISNKKVFV